jgi:hypothetical protein
MFDNVIGLGAIDIQLLWCPGSQAVDVAIAHTENCSNEDCIVNLVVGSTFLSCCSNIFLCHVLSTQLHFAGNIQ